MKKLEEFGKFPDVRKENLAAANAVYSTLTEIDKIEIIRYLSSKMLYKGVGSNQNYSERSLEFIKAINPIRTYKPVMRFLLQVE